MYFNQKRFKPCCEMAKIILEYTACTIPLWNDKRQKQGQCSVSHICHLCWQQSCLTSQTSQKSPGLTKPSWRRLRQKRRTLCPPKRVSVCYITAFGVSNQFGCGVGLPFLPHLPFSSLQWSVYLLSIYCFVSAISFSSILYPFLCFSSTLTLLSLFSASYVSRWVLAQSPSSALQCRPKPACRISHVNKHLICNNATLPHPSNTSLS